MRNQLHIKIKLIWWGKYFRGIRIDLVIYLITVNILAVYLTIIKK